MTVRTDISVNFNLSPRLITIAAPSTEIVLQDLVDTLREIEDELINMDEDHLIDAAGKEDLGGGVSVGITATLRNAQLAFEKRVDVLETGTVTTPDATGVTLTDTGATFSSNGVVPGDVVRNRTDASSIASVLTVTENVLVTDGLTGGTDDQFDSSDAYDILNWTQCNISGGNLVAVDDLDATIDSVFPTFGTQVVRTSSSSATLQELSAIQFASFNGGVTVDLTSPNSGTTFPTGTLEQPVNNFTDALTIANSRGFNTLFVIGSATINTGLTFDGFVLVGESQTKSTLTIDTLASVIGSEFQQATVTGILDGNAKLFDCRIQTLNFVSGFIERCILEGTITLGGSEDAHFLDCWSGIPGPSTPTIDMGGSGQNLALRNYNGGIALANLTGGSPDQEVSIDLNSGQVILENTVTQGNILIRGIGKLTDNSTANVDANDLVRASNINDLWALQGLDVDNPMTVTPTARTTGTIAQTITGDGETTTTVTRTS